jgi:membrane-associated phospholipid phosphatase
MRNLMKQAYSQAQRPKMVILACLVWIILCLPYPTDLQSYRAPHPHREHPLVHFTEDYLRYTNTIVQIALPILFKDKIGMIQLVYVGISTTVATHGLKRLVDKWEVRATRLGQRPNRPNSRHNMPSGHSSMASCAAYFVCRRYGLKHAVYLLPILLLTMHARVALNEHTASAVIVGALLGFVAAAIFTSAHTETSSRLSARITRVRLRQWFMRKPYAKKRMAPLTDASVSKKPASFSRR